MDYKVAKLSQQPPRKWSFPDSKTGAPVPMEAYKVKVEGINEPIEVNRKPGNAPQVGEVLSGTVEDTAFGKRLKPDKKKAWGGSKREYVDHHDDIRIEWAIGQAVQIGMATNALKLDDIETMAGYLLEMADALKKSEPVKTPAEKAMDDRYPNPKDDQPINLDTIPF